MMSINIQHSLILPHFPKTPTFVNKVHVNIVIYSYSNPTTKPYVHLCNIKLTSSSYSHKLTTEKWHGLTKDTSVSELAFKTHLRQSTNSQRIVPNNLQPNDILTRFSTISFSTNCRYTKSEMHCFVGGRLKLSSKSKTST